MDKDIKGCEIVDLYVEHNISEPGIVYEAKIEHDIIYDDDVQVVDEVELDKDAEVVDEVEDEIDVELDNENGEDKDVEMDDEVYITTKKSFNNDQKRYIITRVMALLCRVIL